MITQDEVVGDFRALALQVRAAGLLGRRPGYYCAKIALTLGGFALAWLVFFALTPSWAVLGVAVFLGLVSAQLGFLGHDAGHGQVFASRRANHLLGLAIGNCLIGMSFGWWVTKHTAHHAHPNQVGRDPDVGIGPVGGSAGGRDPASRRGLTGWMDRWRRAVLPAHAPTKHGALRFGRPGSGPKPRSPRPYREPADRRLL